MRLILVVAVGFAALVTAGCGVGPDPARDRAVRAVEDEIAAHGYPDEPVHCTRTPRPWLVEQKASVYLCAVQLGTGFCDLYRVDLRDGRRVVRLDRRKADCTLPI
ncbi:MAG: hypothetical protein U0R50_03535 [Gaiellales bacterium]